MSKSWSSILEEVQQVHDVCLQHLAEKYVASHQQIGESLVSLLGNKLQNHEFDASWIQSQLQKISDRNLSLNALLEKDLQNYYERDFACQSLLEALLLHRGFHALVSHRFAHLFWKQGQKPLAKWLANRTAELWGADIHPAAKIGVGLVIDHCSGVVIGETSEIGQNAFLFHNVTLGGTGRTSGDRHPKVGNHVVIGTGATVLGNIKVGDHAVIAAGAMVLLDVPQGVMVAGVPAKVKGRANAVQ
ncbi:MAG: hypothetical protein KTR30_06290 [Saprospiraceae bacterium]|nr:hypothetical protein [Saprospiraceae bacterium]